MTIKGRNRPRAKPKTLDMDRFLAYQQPQAPTPPMMGTYRAPMSDMPRPKAQAPTPNSIPMPFYNKTPSMPMPMTPGIPRPRMPRAQPMPTVLPARRPAAPQGQFMMDRQGRPVRTVPFINKTGRG